METERLIRVLAADNDWRGQPVAAWLVVGLIIAAAVSSTIFVTLLHLRPGFTSALRNPFFDFKFAVTLALAVPAFGLLPMLARPAAPVGRRLWLLGLPVGLLALGIIADLAVPQRVGWTARLVGTNARTCLTAIPVMSLPLLAAGLIALRHGATTRPMLAGSVAGLMSAGFAATLYAAHCTDDSPLFVACWYTLATALVAGLGAWLGSRLLRF
ncbi:NrsF family protein [Bradyrhizobium sp. WD16]|uniref:NrsF family protein n=1 Tax=Bradyrhizobium sp. WD16 TaxID=1521768 RepID=UPI0020A256C3|nr:DUF1109 domain-containing protein [Bradyrhizobium sp. WD16]UTD29927.1 DUF1109 domain-containing protein [Bradyrhizobium sp. WD16]